VACKRRRGVFRQTVSIPGVMSLAETVAIAPDN